MADFRRWLTALAMVALFVGLASAQATLPGSVSCTTTSTVTPLVRPEGFTELVGDIVLSCASPTGTAVPAVGTPLTTANITVFLAVPITSRLFSNGGSEALLLIDEPGATNATGYGTTVPQTVCPAPLGGGTCQEYVGNTTTGTGVPVQAATGPAFGTAGWNVFQGVVSGNTVTFYGVPVLPPTTSGSNHVYRITNVRANAVGYGGGAQGTAVTANVSVSPASAFTLNQSQLNVAYIGAPLNAGLRKTDNSANTTTATTIAQCNSISTPSGPGSNVLGLRFTPGFPTAFKTRVAVGVPGNTGVSANPTASLNTQNIPGQIYNSESGFTLNVNPSGAGAASTSVTAGLADFGTRLKANFTNIPSGITLYVSATNFVPSTSTFATTATAPYAAAVISETVPDANGTLAFATTVSKPAGYVQVPITSGSGYMTWEVLNANYTTIQDYDFGVIVAYTGTAANTAPATNMTVNLSFAPNPTNGAFTATAAGAASSSLPIPRFADTSTAATFASLNICQTVLLFPYLTTAAGFDTGIAISNTSQDPFGTTPQTGTCALNWYMAGTAGTNPAVTTTASIPGGTSYTTLVSATTNGGANFTGYMFAICNFQGAHGYAAITDVGARGIFSSYLALVVPTGTGTRTFPESLAH